MKYFTHKKKPRLDYSTGKVIYICVAELFPLFSPTFIKSAALRFSEPLEEHDPEVGNHWKKLLDVNFLPEP